MQTAPVDYVLIGHITADLTREGRTLGGTVAYALRTAHAFGLRVGVLTSAAEGEPLLDALSAYGEIVRVLADATTTFQNIYNPKGRVQYVQAVARSLTPDLLPTAWHHAPLVHLAPVADEVAAEFTSAFSNATLIVTLQGWLRTWEGDGQVRFKRWYDSEVLRQLDAVVLSSEDLIEAPELQDELARGVRHLFITQAEQGGIHYTDGKPQRYGTPQVQMVNPTGAGDVFAAALLCAWHKLHDWDAATRVAAGLAAQSVTRAGLDSAPTQREVADMLREQTIL